MQKIEERDSQIGMRRRGEEDRLPLFGSADRRAKDLDRIGRRCAFRDGHPTEIATVHHGLGT